jgi:hypothetical protein
VTAAETRAHNARRFFLSAVTSAMRELNSFAKHRVTTRSAERCHTVQTPTPEIVPENLGSVRASA